jgi:hypothetical protein
VKKIPVIQLRPGWIFAASWTLAVLAFHFAAVGADIPSFLQSHCFECHDAEV